MDLDIMDVITLNNNKEYIIANTLEKDNKKYLLLVNNEENEEIIIAYQDMDTIIIIEDYDKALEIIKQFDTNRVLKYLNTIENS